MTSIMVNLDGEQRIQIWIKTLWSANIFEGDILRNYFGRNEERRKFAWEEYFLRNKGDKSV